MLVLEPMIDEMIPKNPTFFLSREVPEKRKKENFSFFLQFWCF
jgi:hypothetical protein